jgi:hypothetical protein
MQNKADWAHDCHTAGVSDSNPSDLDRAAAGSQGLVPRALPLRVRRAQGQAVRAGTAKGIADRCGHAVLHRRAFRARGGRRQESYARQTWRRPLWREPACRGAEIPRKSFFDSIGQGLPSRRCWHHDQCTPDSRRLAATPKSAESGHVRTFPIPARTLSAVGINRQSAWEDFI